MEGVLSTGPNPSSLRTFGNIWSCLIIDHNPVEMSIKHFVGHRSVAIIIFWIQINLQLTASKTVPWGLCSAKNTTLEAKALCTPYPLVCRKLMWSLKASIKGDWIQTYIEIEEHQSIDSFTTQENYDKFDQISYVRYLGEKIQNNCKTILI